MTILPGLAGVINSFAIPGGISIERNTSDVDADGYPIINSPTVINISPAVIHVVSGRDLVFLPEGFRAGEDIIIFTKVPLRTAKEGSDRELPDIVLYTPAGEATLNRYRVLKSEDWIAQSGHYRSAAKREETD